MDKIISAGGLFAGCKELKGRNKWLACGGLAVEGLIIGDQVYDGFVSIEDAGKRIDDVQENLDTLRPLHQAAKEDYEAAQTEVANLEENKEELEDQLRNVSVTLASEIQRRDEYAEELDDYLEICSP